MEALKGVSNLVGPFGFVFLEFVILLGSVVDRLAHQPIDAIFCNTSCGDHAQGGEGRKRIYKPSESELMLAMDSMYASADSFGGDSMILITLI